MRWETHGFLVVVGMVLVLVVGGAVVEWLRVAVELVNS